MTERLLAVPDGYDPSSQAIVGLMAAGLDDLSRRLRETVAGLEVEHLEWQERPGRSTIGMLMAHLAASEIGYFYVACAGLSYQDAKPILHEHLGIDWDGVLVGIHATSLKGRDLDGYLDLLARARRATHELLKTWDDLSLGRTLGGAGTGMTLSQRWLLYHVLEHFAAHFGQICSVLHCMRDRDVPGLPKKRVVF
jgi:hypothetical protein